MNIIDNFIKELKSFKFFSRNSNTKEYFLKLNKIIYD